MKNNCNVQFIGNCINRCTTFLYNFRCTEYFSTLYNVLFYVAQCTFLRPSFSEFLGDLFNPLCRMCPDQLGETLRATLATENFPTKYISRDSKETFVQSVLKSSHQKRRLKVIIKEFSLECRGYNNRSIR